MAVSVHTSMDRCWASHNKWSAAACADTAVATAHGRHRGNAAGSLLNPSQRMHLCYFKQQVGNFVLVLHFICLVPSGHWDVPPLLCACHVSSRFALEMHEICRSLALQRCSAVHAEGCRYSCSLMFGTSVALDPRSSRSSHTVTPKHFEFPSADFVLPSRLCPI
jgi:hypothetical protein